MKPEESSSMSTDTLPSSNSDTEKFESTFIQGFVTKFILYEENKGRFCFKNSNNNSIATCQTLALSCLATKTTYTCSLGLWLSINIWLLGSL